MRIVCIGGGPAGLYFAILMKRQDPRHEITVFERNRPDDTFGWGVVFSDQTLENLAGGRPGEHGGDRRRLHPLGRHRRPLQGPRDHARRGHGFCGIGRKRLLNILQDRAREPRRRAGVRDARSTSLEEFADADLIVAADGINSRIRDRYAEHLPARHRRAATCQLRLARHARGCSSAFTFVFEKTEARLVPGPCLPLRRRHLDLHRRDAARRPGARSGLDAHEQRGERSPSASALFAKHLDGHALMTNAATCAARPLAQLPARRSARPGVTGNLVLMGDAAAHRAFLDRLGHQARARGRDRARRATWPSGGRDLPGALARLRGPSASVEVLRLQIGGAQLDRMVRGRRALRRAAPRAVRLFAADPQPARQPREPAAARPGLARGRRGLVRERRPARRAAAPAPPMFTPFRLRGMALANRIVVSPMAMYTAVDGMPDDFHLVHLGARAQGGAGLVFTEMTCVSPEARITPGCPGLWNAAHDAAWKRIVDFVHARQPGEDRAAARPCRPQGLDPGRLGGRWTCRSRTATGR